MAQENTGVLCGDGIDNDGDGQIDCDDQDCVSLANDGCVTCFNDGISFADVVLEFSQPCPNSMFTDPTQALGVANDRGQIGSSNFVSLGNGGFVRLGFVNNLVVNSGTPDADIWVFEIGPAVEAMTIELQPADASTRTELISSGIVDTDGDGYFDFGGVSGATSSLDIDAIASGFVAGSLRFDAIKLTDVPSSGGCSGVAPGADLDAVCALSSIPLEVCSNGLDDDGDGLIDCNDPDISMECCCLVNQTLDLGPNISGCAGDTIRLSPTETFASYQWSTGSQSPEINVVTPGLFLLTVTLNNGCELSDDILVTFGSLPLVQFDTLKCPGTTININGEDIADSGIFRDTIPGRNQACDTIVEYTVNDHILTTNFLGPDQTVCGDRFTLISPFTNTIWPDMTSGNTFDISVSDEIIASAVGLNGCIIQDTIVIQLVNQGPMYIPNAFSPNNDGINDHFMPLGANQSSEPYTLTIFDRWGNQLFQSSGTDVRWNGTANSKLLNAGTYIYSIEYQNQACDKSEIFSGDLLLIR